MSLSVTRTDRLLEESYPLHSTPDNCGPGSHNLGDAGNWSVDESKVAPFQSSDQRPFQKQAPHPSEETPGPGSYPFRGLGGSIGGTTEEGSDARHGSEPHEILGPHRSSFRARAPQISPIGLVPGSSEYMRSTVYENPGPGEYTLPRSLGGVGATLGAPLPPVGPSLAHTGEPALYDQEVRWDAARSTNFHASASERSLFVHPVSPGPARYNTTGELEKGPASPFTSTTTRPHIVGPEGPGPGTYPAKSALRSDSLPSNFRSGSPRELYPDAKRSSPDPTHYQGSQVPFAGSPTSTGGRRGRSVGGGTLPRTFHGVSNPQLVLQLRDTDGFPGHAFHSSVPRFSGRAIQGNGCDPGTYEVEKAIGQSITSKLRAMAAHKGKGVFGAVSDRSQGSAFNGNRNVIEPGTYQAEERPQSTTSVTHNAFRSVSPRMPKSRSDSGLIPGPGIYDPLHKAEYRSKLRPGNVERVCFGAGVARTTLFDASQSDFPGPGAHDPRLLPPNLGSGIVKSTDTKIAVRSKALDASGGAVGPGLYKVDLKWLRKSFNATHDEFARRAQGKELTFAGLAPKGPGLLRAVPVDDVDPIAGGKSGSEPPGVPRRDRTPKSEEELLEMREKAAAALHKMILGKRQRSQAAIEN
mmetsp:Transcript_49622/g.106293  ORF Transcript_49622/g.106293 Transcript_49622/m.106293 type:complete len:637 (+) Transcript_49622:80-1990(+)